MHCSVIFFVFMCSSGVEGLVLQFAVCRSTCARMEHSTQMAHTFLNSNTPSHAQCQLISHARRRKFRQLIPRARLPNYQITARTATDTRQYRSRSITPIPVATVAYQVILEPGIGQSREFESPSAYLHKFVGTFSCAQIDLRKARERELATLHEKIDEQWDC